MMTSGLSIVIPTRNGATTLPGLLDGIARQRVSRPVEVVVVDSGSTDGTLELVRERVDQVIEIPLGAFDHGLTRNIGIEAAQGDLVVMLVQDAEPATPTLLEALTRPLLADARVAGTFARQTPRDEASAIARHYLSGWVTTAVTPRSVGLEPGEFQTLSPRERLIRCAFDNVCSCIRRRVWQDLPFRQTPIGEDLAWAKEVLLHGHRLVYVPEAMVIHSHDRPVAYEWARTRALHRRLYELFGLRTIATLPGLVRAVFGSVALHLRLERSHPERLMRALALAVAWPLGQYLGGRDGVRAQENPSRADR